MSEWMTTGEMVDKLKVGGTAELKGIYKIPKKVGPSYDYVTKNDDGDILWCTENRNQIDHDPVKLFGHVCNWKWRILPKLLSFEEAMKALRKGKTIKYNFSEDNDSRNIRVNKNGMKEISSVWILSNRWTIEEDEQ